MTLQLEHGKTYRDRKGDEYVVTQRATRALDADYPFEALGHPECGDTNFWTKGGLWQVGEEDLKDFIALVKDTEADTETSKKPMFMWRYGSMIVLSPSCELLGEFEYIGEVQ
jgi:hypothetical protein